MEERTLTMTTDERRPRQTNKEPKTIPVKDKNTMRNRASQCYFTHCFSEEDWAGMPTASAGLPECRQHMELVVALMAMGLGAKMSDCCRMLLKLQAKTSGRVEKYRKRKSVESKSAVGY